MLWSGERPLEVKQRTGVPERKRGGRAMEAQRILPDSPAGVPGGRGRPSPAGTGWGEADAC